MSHDGATPARHQAPSYGMLNVEHGGLNERCSVIGYVPLVRNGLGRRGRAVLGISGGRPETRVAGLSARSKSKRSTKDMRRLHHSTGDRTCPRDLGANPSRRRGRYRLGGYAVR